MKRRIRGRYYLVVIFAIVCILIALFKAPTVGMGAWFTNKNGIQECNTAESKKDTIQRLRVKTENTYRVWQSLIEDTAFSDLCSEVYARGFEEIADEYITCYEKFDAIDGDNTSIENYSEYLQYFTTYKLMGESLLEFVDALRGSKYDDALELLSNLRILNSRIPIIE